MSPSRLFLCVVPLALIALALAACGNKGPLVKPPPKPAATQQPASPTQTPEPADH